MSTDASSTVVLTGDLRMAHVARFSVGTTLAAGVAYAFSWPIHFLTPVLTIVFLSKMIPVDSYRFLDLLAQVVVAALLGAVFTVILAKYPLAFVLSLGLVMFYLFYLVHRGGSLIFCLLCLLGLIVMPMVGQAYDPLVPSVAKYFALNAVVAVLAFKVAWILVPDPPGSPEPEKSTFQPGYSEPAAWAALKTTIVLLPVVVIFLAYGLTSWLLVLIYTLAIGIDSSTAHVGWHHGMEYLFNTIVGGLAALVVYWMLVAVPEYHFFLILWFTSMWIIGGMIWSDHPLAKNMASAGIAFTILVTSSIGPGADFFDKFVIRFAMIAVASLYVTGAMMALERYRFGEEA